MDNMNQLALPNSGCRMVFLRKGLPEKLEPYFYKEDIVCDFAISGQNADASLLYYLLHVEAGNLPVIILHNNNMSVKAEAALVWTNKFGSLEAGGTIWSGDDGGFEPFLGMEEMDIIRILRCIAESQKQRCAPQFDKVVSAHLKILRLMNCDYSLSGLHYLCGFEDLGEFHDNIMMLPCPDWEKNLILSSLGLTNAAASEQFELFRMLIRQLAHEARISGWADDGQPGEMNITTAIEQRAMLLLNVSAARSPMVLTYLREELLLRSEQEFLLIIDDVHLAGSGIIPVLSDAGKGFRFVLLTSSLLDLIGGDRREAQSFCGRLSRIILLKHSVETTARDLVELLGTHEVDRETRTRGTGREFLAWLPGTQTRGVSVTREDRHRIEARELLKLRENQAIVFDAETDQIIRI